MFDNTQLAATGMTLVRAFRPQFMATTASLALLGYISTTVVTDHNNLFKEQFVVPLTGVWLAALLLVRLSFPWTAKYISQLARFMSDITGSDFGTLSGTDLAVECNRRPYKKTTRQRRNDATVKSSANRRPYQEEICVKSVASGDHSVSSSIADIMNSGTNHHDGQDEFSSTPYFGSKAKSRGSSSSHSSSSSSIRKFRSSVSTTRQQNLKTVRYIMYDDDEESNYETDTIGQSTLTGLSAFPSIQEDDDDSDDDSTGTENYSLVNHASASISNNLSSSLDEISHLPSYKSSTHRGSKANAHSRSVSSDKSHIKKSTNSSNKNPRIKRHGLSSSHNHLRKHRHYNEEMIV